MDKDIQKQPQGADGGGNGLSALFGQQRGNQDSQPASVETGESNGSPQYVTREDLEKIRQDAINEARKTAQSISDKAASVSKKAYQEAMGEIARLKGLGIPMTPEQEQAIREQKLDEAIKQESNGEPATQQQNIDMGTQQQAVQPPAWLKRDVDALIAETRLELLPQEMNEAGLTLALMNENPRQFYETFREALHAKRDNIVKGGQFSRAATPGIGTQGQSGNWQQQYESEIRAAAGNGRKIEQIRRNYQERGFDTTKVEIKI